MTEKRLITWRSIKKYCDQLIDFGMCAKLSAIDTTYEKCKKKTCPRWAKLETVKGK